MKKLTLSVTLVLILQVLCFSQDENATTIEFDLGADIVSSYIWRGLLLDPAPNIQGWGELAAGSFFCGVWASGNFNGSYGETDVYAGFSAGKLTATLTNYFTGYADVFNFKKDESMHAGELMMQYSISENFPLQITAASVIYGADLKLDSIDINEDAYFQDKNNFSTYIELMYPFSINSVDFEFYVGGVTHESYFYDTEGAALTNISLKSTKNIKITESFEIPVSLQLAVNPELESVYTVFSFSF